MRSKIGREFYANKVSRVTSVLGRWLTFATVVYLVFSVIEWLLGRRGRH